MKWSEPYAVCSRKNFVSFPLKEKWHPASRTSGVRMPFCIREVGVHALRHTYATRLFEKGVDIKIISELLGHSSTEITYRIYVYVIESLKASAVEGLDLY